MVNPEQQARNRESSQGHDEFAADSQSEATSDGSSSYIGEEDYLNTGEDGESVNSNMDGKIYITHNIEREDESANECSTLGQDLSSNRNELRELIFQLSVTFSTASFREGQPSSSLLVYFSRDTRLLCRRSKFLVCSKVYAVSLGTDIYSAPTLPRVCSSLPSLSIYWVSAAITISSAPTV